ncbi:MAG: hypothetical protein JWR90_2134 [Marmoricola sp.]|jgi:hypothetical protein|nr:hypothetical protein [Marmoricola sp.]
MHYRRLLNLGDPNAPGRRVQATVCVIDGCQGRPVAKDLCRKHYYAQARAEFLAANPPAAKVSVPCSVEGCGQVASARGWCGAHYQRWRRFGAPDFFPPDLGKQCSIDGCIRPTNARGLCDQHYYRWSRYGDPLLSKNRPRVSQTPTEYAPRQCATCGETFDPSTSAVRKYCGRRCRPSRASVGVNNRRSVERLAREDGWMCQLCKEPIDPNLYWPNLRAGSVDHIVQVQHGGNDDRANLRLTHLTCNLASPKAT